MVWRYPWLLWPSSIRRSGLFVIVWTCLKIFNQARKMSRFVYPCVFATAITFACPFSMRFWLNFAFTKMKRGGINCPLAFIQNINIALLPLSPDVSYPLCCPYGHMILPVSFELNMSAGAKNVSSSSPEVLVKKILKPELLWILQLSLNLWIRHSTCMTMDVFSWDNSQSVFQQEYFRH